MSKIKNKKVLITIFLLAIFPIGIYNIISFGMDQLSQKYLSEGNYQKAISIIKESLDFKVKVLGEKSYFTHNQIFKLADTYLMQGDFKNAKKYYEKLYSYRPKNSVLDCSGFDFIYSPDLLLRTYILDKDYNSAELLLKNYEPHCDLEDMYTSLHLLELLIAQGKYNEAEKTIKNIQRYSQINEQFSSALKTLEIRYYLAKGDYKNTIKNFNDYREDTRQKDYCSNVSAYLDASSAYAATGNLEKATYLTEVYTLKIKELCGNEYLFLLLKGYNRRAEYLIKMNKPDEACKVLKEASYLERSSKFKNEQKQLKLYCTK